MLRLLTGSFDTCFSVGSELRLLGNCLLLRGGRGILRARINDGRRQRRLKVWLCVRVSHLRIKTGWWRWMRGKMTVHHARMVVGRVVKRRRQRQRWRRRMLMMLQRLSLTTRRIHLLIVGVVRVVSMMRVVVLTTVHEHVVVVLFDLQEGGKFSREGVE